MFFSFIIYWFIFFFFPETERDDDVEPEPHLPDAVCSGSRLQRQHARHAALSGQLSLFTVFTLSLAMESEMQLFGREGLLLLLLHPFNPQGQDNEHSGAVLFAGGTCVQYWPASGPLLLIYQGSLPSVHVLKYMHPQTAPLLNVPRGIQGNRDQVPFPSIYKSGLARNWTHDP